MAGMIRLRGRAGGAAICILASLRLSSHAAGGGQSRGSAPLRCTLIAKRRLSPDSHLLRYSLPSGRRTLGDDPTLPTCVKVLHSPSDGGADEGTAGETTAARPLERSYSPVSHPAVEGCFDLIVKSYPQRRCGGGGVMGRYLCDMSVGETILGTLKPPRDVHGRASVLGRWTDVGLVAGGTGIAPLLQIARLILDSRDDADADTTVRLLYVNRREGDILARGEIEDLARSRPTRFVVTYSLTDERSVPEGWTGHVGRGDLSMIASSLPPPTGGDGRTMIFVCGTDGFVSTWGGPVVRAPPTDRTDGGHGKERGGKIQGLLLGLLREAGYAEEEVFKY